MKMCPKFGFEITDSMTKTYCVNCFSKCDILTRPRFELGKVDPFELGRLLAEKRKQEALGVGKKHQINEKHLKNPN